MSIVALAIGIEKYLTKDFESVKFAENDASEFVVKLTELGANKSDVELVVSNEATRSTIMSKLKQVVKTLKQEDYFYFYYAGHGYSSSSKNYITCSDTLKNDLDNTSINLQEIFQLINASKSNCSILFIDACQSGMPIDENMRGLYSHFNDSELKAFFDKAKGTVCFSACHEDEYSYSHASLSHGLWSYHILKALSGDAKKAIARNKYITIESLQNYLADEVPLEVRNLLVGKISQTPWMTGSLSSDFPVADIEHLLIKKIPAYGPIQNLIKDANISSMCAVPIKSLSGFKKGKHRVPDSVNYDTERFVRGISENEIKKLADDTRDALRDHFKLKRKECTLKVSDDGVDIITPHFDYHLSVSIDEDDTSYVVFNEFIDNINDSSVILSENFNQAFKDGFDSVEFEFENSISVKELIDNLEDHGFTSSSLAFDDECTYCEIEFDGHDASVRIEAYSIRFTANKRIEPKKLFSLVSDGVLSLEDHKPLKMLPLPSSK